MNAKALRSHQTELLAVVRAIAAGEAGEVRDVLAAVTPGGGKSLLPVLAAQALMAAGICERICWVVPRDSLRLQAEEVFADPAWRQALGHDLSVRAADNTPGDPCRGLAGYVTTYQGIAAAPDLHLAAFRRLLAVGKAGVTPEVAEHPEWPEALTLAAPLPDDLQGVFLLLAQAALAAAPCPSDAAIARAYGTRSTGRARRALGYIEEQGTILCRPDLAGRRIVTIAGLGWETAPGDAGEE